jgi:hypothetical protein
MERCASNPDERPTTSFQDGLPVHVLLQSLWWMCSFTVALDGQPAGPVLDDQVDTVGSDWVLGSHPVPLSDQNRDRLSLKALRANMAETPYPPAN